MSAETFERLEQVLREDGAAAGFDLLVRMFREQKKYPLLFEARLMQKRMELSLPLVSTGGLNDLPEDRRGPIEAAFIAAAREVGSLFLADGEVARAWPYFRAIGESTPVGEALETCEPESDTLDRIIEIAFHEGVNPRRGFELVLSRWGICRAISYFQQFPGPSGKPEALRLLVRTLCDDLAANLRRAITQVEGAEPAGGIREMISGRDWLFEGNNYYIDTSHVASIVQFAPELTDRSSLVQAFELADYGARLAPMFQFRGDPPFENGFRDYAMYLTALSGENVEAAITHFREKLASTDPEQDGTAPAQVLVLLLTRLGRHAEAIEVSLEHLNGVDASQLVCPNVFQLCQEAGDAERLERIARERSDLLNFAAAVLQRPVTASR